jgi:hypothetical protein
MNTIQNSTKSKIDAVTATYQTHIQTSQYVSIIAIASCSFFAIVIISCDIGKILSNLDLIKSLKKSIMSSFETDKVSSKKRSTNPVNEEKSKDYKNKIINYERKFLNELKKVNAQSN